ncbi:MAG: hypothetical protein HQL59_00800 [Magnetococcales bacterium]|nr:hypothetical protein [Magnetococcales bacterium]
MGAGDGAGAAESAGIRELWVSESLVNVVREEGHILYPDLYEQIGRIIRQALCFLHERRPEELDDIHDCRSSNTIFLDGGRGMGKTHLLMNLESYLKKQNRSEGGCSRESESESFRKVLFLRPFDPTLIEIERSSYLIPSMVAHVYEGGQLALRRGAGRGGPHAGGGGRCGAHSGGKQWADREEEAEGRIDKAMEDVGQIWYSIQKSGETKGIDTIGYSQDSHRLEQALHNLFDAVARATGNDLLVLPIDDLDMAPDHAHHLLDIIRRYLNSPRLLPVVSGQIDNFKDNKWHDFQTKNLGISPGSHLFPPHLTGVESLSPVKDPEGSLKRHVSQFVEGYFSKVFPLHNRIYIGRHRHPAGGWKEWILKFARGTGDKRQTYAIHMENYFALERAVIHFGVGLADAGSPSQSLFDGSLRNLIQALHAIEGEVFDLLAGIDSLLKRVGRDVITRKEKLPAEPALAGWYKGLSGDRQMRGEEKEEQWVRRMFTSPVAWQPLACRSEASWWWQDLLAAGIASSLSVRQNGSAVVVHGEGLWSRMRAVVLKAGEASSAAYRQKEQEGLDLWGVLSLERQVEAMGEAFDPWAMIRWVLEEDPDLGDRLPFLIPDAGGERRRNRDPISLVLDSERWKEMEGKGSLLPSEWFWAELVGSCGSSTRPPEPAVISLDRLFALLFSLFQPRNDSGMVDALRLFDRESPWTGSSQGGGGSGGAKVEAGEPVSRESEAGVKEGPCGGLEDEKQGSRSEGLEEYLARRLSGSVGLREWRERLARLALRWTAVRVYHLLSVFSSQIKDLDAQVRLLVTEGGHSVDIVTYLRFYVLGLLNAAAIVEKRGWVNAASLDIDKSCRDEGADPARVIPAAVRVNCPELDREVPSGDCRGCRRTDRLVSLYDALRCHPLVRVLLAGKGAGEPLFFIHVEKNRITRETILGWLGEPSKRYGSDLHARVEAFRRWVGEVSERFSRVSRTLGPSELWLLTRILKDPELPYARVFAELKRLGYGDQVDELHRLFRVPYTPPVG